MKIIIIIIGIVVIVAGVFIIRGQKHQVGPAEPSSAGFLLAVISDDVLVKNPEDSDFKKITGNANVNEGAEIKTLSSGQAKLLYPNGTISVIDKNSEIKIESLSGNGEKSGIRLVIGGLWSKIKNALGKGDYYEVKTENVVASVRGTIFASQFINKTTNIFGLENKVQVVALDKNGKEIPGTDTNVISGNKLVLKTTDIVKSDQPLKTQPMTSADFSSPLIRDNLKNFLDEAVSVSPTPPPVATKSPSPTAKPGEKTPSPTPVSTLVPTQTPTPSINSGPTAPTAAPASEPTISSILPTTISSGQEFTINGSGFTAGRNVKQVASVRLNEISVPFAVIDSETIFVTVDSSFDSGSYTVEIQSLDGVKIKAGQQVTVR